MALVQFVKLSRGDMWVGKIGGNRDYRMSKSKSNKFLAPTQPGQPVGSTKYQGKGRGTVWPGLYEMNILTTLL